VLPVTRFTAKEVALAVCFTALYVVLSFLPMFQIISFFGKAITAATIIAPIIGILLGTYLCVTCTFLGGMIGLLVNPLFSPPSLVAGIVTALCASLLYANKRNLCILIYSALLLAFGFYPSIGPLWLYPPQMWFQFSGLILLILPLQSGTRRNAPQNYNSNFVVAFFVTCLTSTLAGQIAGSLVFEAISWPNIFKEVGFWQGYWFGLTFLYPAERTVIALLAASAGTALHRTLKTAHLLRRLDISKKDKV
jgi:hypothetical protein